MMQVVHIIFKNASNLRELPAPSSEVLLEELDMLGPDACDDDVREGLLPILLLDHSAEVVILFRHVAHLCWL